jgi:hypothetical protein
MTVYNNVASKSIMTLSQGDFSPSFSYQFLWQFFLSPFLRNGFVILIDPTNTAQHSANVRETSPIHVIIQIYFLTITFLSIHTQNSWEKHRKDEFKTAIFFFFLLSFLHFISFELVSDPFFPYLDTPFKLRQKSMVFIFPDWEA